MADSPLTPQLRGILDGLDLGGTARRYLSKVADPRQSTPDNLARILEGNQAYVQFFSATELLRGRKPGWLEETESPVAKAAAKPRKTRTASQHLVAWLGASHSRNAILCLRQLRSLDLLPRTPGVPIELGAKKRLKRAIECEELSQDRRIAHSEANFAGGLLFDWVLLVGSMSRPVAGRLAEYAQKCWQNALHSALIAYRAASQLQRFSLEHSAFSGAIALECGQLAMSLLHGEDYLKFLTHPALAIDPELRPMMEAQRFGLHSEALAALVAASFSPMQPIASAVLRAREPFFLKSREPELQRLAALLGASSSLAQGNSLSPSTLRGLVQAGINESQINDAHSWARQILTKGQP